MHSGDWVRTFSGKEILHHLRGSFTHLTERTGGSSADYDADLAKRITRRWHKLGGTVPSELVSLRNGLRQRARI